MLRILSKLVVSRYFPISFKIITSFFLIALIVIGFSASSDNAIFLKQLRNFNLANLIVWSYWWPLIIVGSVFFGRIWCMVCPVEMITTFFAAIGLKKVRPKWLKNGWAITIFYILILFVGIHGFAIHRNPTYMAIYLLVLIAIAILTGFWFKKNTFCKYVCPIGFLLKLYSRFSFFGWRVKQKNICKSCTDKSCISDKYQYQLNYKSCGVDLYPANIDSNVDCLLCGGCLKTCNSYQSTPNIARPNPGFVFTSPKKTLLKNTTLSSAEVLFAMIVSGFIIYEILSEFSITKTYLMFFPDKITDMLSLSHPIAKGILKSVLLFFILPLIIWFIPFAVSKIQKSKLSFITYLKNYAVAFIPIMAAAHLCKALLKTTSRIPYFEHVFSDITGMQNTQMFLDGTITLSKLPQPALFIISVILVITISIGITISWIIVKKVNKKLLNTVNIGTYLIPIIYGALFLLSIIFWRF